MLHASRPRPRRRRGEPDRGGPADLPPAPASTPRCHGRSARRCRRVWTVGASLLRDARRTSAVRPPYRGASGKVHCGVGWERPGDGCAGDCHGGDRARGAAGGRPPVRRARDRPAGGRHRRLGLVPPAALADARRPRRARSDGGRRRRRRRSRLPRAPRDRRGGVARIGVGGTVVRGPLEPVRPQPVGERQPPTAGPMASTAALRRARRRPRDERGRGGLRRPRVDALSCATRRRRLARERLEDVDHERAAGRRGGRLHADGGCRRASRRSPPS